MRMRISSGTSVRGLGSSAAQARRLCHIGSANVRQVAAATATAGPARPQARGSADSSHDEFPGPARPRPPASVSGPPSRLRSLEDGAKPFSDFLTDTHRRQHDYLRISVTERCNLRCLYCMPEEGVPLSPPRELLTTPEIVLIAGLFVSQGVTKIRLTGGEPTVRRDIVPLMRQIGALRPHGLRDLCLTTNGLSLHRKLEPMVEAGLTGVNLSLDTLDPWQFQLMTRRQGFAAVRRSIDRILELNRAGAGIRLKINCVVMRGLNDREILPFVELTRDDDLEVRFIEYMPFDGNRWSEAKMFPYDEMLRVIRAAHPGLRRLRGHENDTSKTFQVPGFRGRVGFITSMTHNFCGTCNRLRVTSDGNLKVCLFGNAEVSLRDIVRRVNAGDPIDDAAFAALKDAAAEDLRRHPPSEPPPLLAPNSRELLEVIGMAVKRKKAKHAGLGELEHMKNRPMILIGAGTTGYNGHPRRRSWHASRITAPPSSHWTAIPIIGLPLGAISAPQQHARPLSTTRRLLARADDDDGGGGSGPGPGPARLTHVSGTGSAHMVSIADKAPTRRVAVARCRVRFSAGSPAGRLVRENALRKGDVLAVARVAGIMAAKRTPELIPLCHPVAVSRVAVELEVVPSAPAGGRGEEQAGEGVEIEAMVECDGKTGVEMEALTAASGAALTVYDMCKAVDKGMVIEGLRVVLKEGGRSGTWIEGGSAD